MPEKARWLAGLLLLLIVQKAEAATEGWVLALSWHPGFCTGHIGAPDCLKLAAPRLTLHGLWPETSERGEGDYCGVTSDMRDHDRPDGWCQLPAISLSAGTSLALDAVMPGRLACLDRHEWLRHGTCSGLAAEDYFILATRLAGRVNALAIGKALTTRAGGATTAADLTRLLAEDFGSAGVAAITFVCDARNGVAHLLEMRISLIDDGPRRFPAPAALHIPAFPTSHPCPAVGQIVIDGAP